MGMSPSAHLFYGFVGEEYSSMGSLWLPEDYEPGPDEDYPDWEDRWRTVTGFDEVYQEPAEPYPHMKRRWELGPGEEPQEPTPEQKAIQEAYKAYWSHEREWLKKHPPGCEISSYGNMCSDYTTPYVYVVGAGVSADWEEHDIDIKKSVFSETETAVRALAIHQFCDKMGISLEGRSIGWHLVCTYG